MPLKYLPLLALLLPLIACTPSGDESAAGSEPAAPVKTAQTSAALGGKYTLRPTDGLRVEMYQEPDYRVEVSVSQEGDVTLPLIGTIHVAGKTVNETQQLLTTRYKSFFKEPNVSLLLIKYAERKVYIDGMVGRPGPVLFPPEESMTLGRAIASASGILPRGERSDVKLKRIVDGKEVSITIDMNEISSGKKPDIELIENDYIYVRDSRI